MDSCRERDDLGTPVFRSGPTSRIIRRLHQEPTKNERNPSGLLLSPSTSFNKSIFVESKTPRHPFDNLHPRSSFGDYSVVDYNSLKPYSLFNGVDDTEIVFHHSGNKDQIPFDEKANSLFIDFHYSISNGDSFLDTLAEFETLLENQIQWNSESKINISSFQIAKDKELVESFKKEKNTWRLFGVLTSGRSKVFHDDDDVMEDLSKEVLTGERRLIERIFERDSDLRESQSIIDWLEGISAQEINSLKLEHFADSPICWENTLNALKKRKESEDKKERHKMVREMDPDVQRRTGQSLHDYDAKDQSLLLSAIFSLIRSGLLEKAQDLCIKVGQPWRAATFEGWKLLHDPNIEDNLCSDSTFPLEGNPNRDLWKRSAWKLTLDNRMPILERASYAALCGNLTTLLSVCKSWEDCLWALLRTHVDVKVEREIREKSVFRSYVPLPQEYWDTSFSSLDSVMEALTALDKEQVINERESPYRVVQTHLIKGNYSSLVDYMVEFVQNEGRSKDIEEKDQGHLKRSHYSRFFVHLILIFRRLLEGDSSSASLISQEEIVIVSYILMLIDSEHVHLIAWYTSQLRKEEQIRIYSQFLHSVSFSSDRQLVLDLGVEASLPMEEILIDVVLTSREIQIMDEEEEEKKTKKMTKSLNNEQTHHHEDKKKEGDSELGTLSASLTKGDKFKIESLQWLTFFESQRHEAIFHTNSLLRAFIAEGKIEAASLALSSIPKDSLQGIESLYESPEKIPVSVKHSIKEFLALEAYLVALEAFNDWFQYFSLGEPIKPQLPQKAKFVEKVAYEQKEQIYLTERERWSAAQITQSHSAKDKLLSVLHFPQGWLLEDDDDGNDEEDDNKVERDNVKRKEELVYLRITCLPQIVILLHKVYHHTRQYKEAIGLVNVVASENTGIFKVYNKEELKNLLFKIRESSLAALETGSTDTLGFTKK